MQVPNHSIIAKQLENRGFVYLWQKCIVKKQSMLTKIKFLNSGWFMANLIIIRKLKNIVFHTMLI